MTSRLQISRQRAPSTFSNMPVNPADPPPPGPIPPGNRALAARGRRTREQRNRGAKTVPFISCTF